MEGAKAQILTSFGAQLVRYIAPLLFYPMLLRTLSTGEFATFVVLLATGMILGQFIEFGFGLSAVRELSNRANDAEAAAGAAGEVLFGKLAMTLIAVPMFLLISTLFLPPATPQVLALTVAIGLAYGFTPNWYYIGIGKAHLLAFLEVATVGCQLGLVVLVTVLDGGFEAAAFAILLPVAGLALFAQVAAARALRPSRPTARRLWAGTMIAYHFFVATNAPALTNRAMLMILSATAAPAQVASFAVSERIATALISTLAIVMRVILPRVTALHAQSVSASRRLARRFIVVGFGLYATGAAFLAATSSLWVEPAFGSKLVGGASMVALFLALVPISTLGRLVSLLLLVPARQERFVQMVTLGVCLTGIVLAYPASTAGAFWLIGLRLAVELIITSFLVVRARALDGLSTAE